MGELEGRRFRPEFYLCVNNCLWQIDWRLDLDGFGGNTPLQRGVIYFDADQLNPWLPSVQFGMDTTNSGPASLSRQGSGSHGRAGRVRHVDPGFRVQHRQRQFRHDPYLG